MRPINTNCRLGLRSALILLNLGAIYMITGSIGALSGGGFWPPKQIDPYLAILEALIILMAPFMVLMMAAVHAYAVPEVKTYSLSALGFMILLAGMTSSILFIRLTVLRRIDSSSLLHPDFFLYADLLAWDLFFGLSMLFPAPVFKAGRLEKAIRIAMIVSGSLCIIGILGPALGDLRFQAFGIIGYTWAFFVVCLLLLRLFNRHLSYKV